MLVAYTAKAGQLSVLPQDSEHLDHALWLDVISPVPKDQARLQTLLGGPLSVPSELGDIEASARFYETPTGLHIHSDFFYEASDGKIVHGTVAFVLASGRLYTLREHQFPAFRAYQARALAQATNILDAYTILLGLFDTKVEQLADIIEAVYAELERLGRSILERDKARSFDLNLQALARAEDTTSKIRSCLVDTQRALSALIRKGRVPVEQLEQAREILRDIESLLPHNEAVFQRINFLSQSAIGFIDLEQNKVMKQLAVISTVFLGPNLLAAIFGMNFKILPLLECSAGFYYSVVLMFFSVWITFFILRKGSSWL